jgi:hypothetical protein
LFKKKQEGKKKEREKEKAEDYDSDDVNYDDDGALKWLIITPTKIYSPLYAIDARKMILIIIIVSHESEVSR